MKQMTVKGAIFDMAGTLVNSLFFWEVFWKSFGKKYLKKEQFTVPDEVDRKIRAMTLVEAMAAIKETFGLSVDVEELADFAYSDLERFYREEATVKEGVIAFLEHLKARGIPMCVASATDIRYVKMALESHGLLSYFDLVLSCADIGVGKEHPDIYLLAEQKLGLPKEALCVFEDSYVALETAKKAGFLTVGVFDRYNNFAPDRMRAASCVYLDEHKTMADLISVIGV